MFSSDLKQKQPFVTEFFTKVLEKNFISRAYLLAGNAFTDKKSLVKELNQILNCELNKQSFPFRAACGNCQNCKWIANDTHLRTPINIVGSTEKKKLVDVKDLRENILPQLIQNSDFFRIVIIEDASFSVLTKDPATTLLKTIEEAKPNTMFMLFADQEDRVLNTIRSRSQIIRFKSENKEEFSEEALEKFAEVKELLLTGVKQNKLAMLLNSETLAELKAELLIEIFYLLEEEIMLSGNPLPASQQILEIENTIQKLKSFVRPKSEIYDLSKGLAACHHKDSAG